MLTVKERCGTRFGELLCILDALAPADRIGHHSIARGNRIIFSVLAVHHSKAIWGEDALEFKYVPHSKLYD